MKFSSNALTARYATSQGWLCETVQSWRGRQRHDAFGIGDSLILDPALAQAALVQNCSYGTLKQHRQKIDANSARAIILACGIGIWLFEWRRIKEKRGGKRLARGWYLRTQAAIPGGRWSPLHSWNGPWDLYPPKKS